MNKTLQRPTALVLVGLTFMWFGIMVGNYVGLFERVVYSETGKIIAGTASVLRPSTYIFLIALVGIALFTAPPIDLLTCSWLTKCQERFRFFGSQRLV